MLLSQNNDKSKNVDTLMQNYELQSQYNDISKKDFKKLMENYEINQNSDFVNQNYYK